MKRKFSFLLVAAACLCGGEVANGQPSDEYMFFLAAEREKNAQLLNSTRKKAEQGDAEAQSLLSWMHYVGFTNGVKEEKAEAAKEAAKWLRKLAEQGDAESQNNLGRMYAYGQGGLRGRNVEAAKWYRKAAEQGLAQAQFTLGELYANGRGVPKDEVEAAKWYQKAADQGYGKQNTGRHAKAQNNLGEIFCKIGVMYEDEAAEQKNDREAHACISAAFSWYRRAANMLELRDAGVKAMVKNNVARIGYKIGVRLENGKGVTKNLSAAYAMYRGASSYAGAQYKLADDYVTTVRIGGVYSREGVLERRDYTKENIEQIYKNAANWYEKAAAQGHAQAQFKLEAIQGGAEAQFKLGKRYEKGEGMPQDYVETANWYRMAAEQGFAEAQNKLGFMYGNGKGVRKDDVEAVKWYRKAAEQGYAWGQNNLGWHYYSGKGVRQDYEEAAKWYRKAAKQGNVNAKKNLGELYYKFGNRNYHIADNYDTDPPGSTGIEKMNRAIKKKEAYVKASKWYLKAANEGHAGAQRKLGMMYSKGEGVPKNDIEAYAWFFLAGASEISILEKRITEWQLHNAQKRATELQHLIGAE